MISNLNRYAFVCIALFFAAALSVALFAQTREQAIQNGLAYLRTHQNPDGSLGTDGLAGRDTAAAARALASLDPQDSSTSKALIWLKSHELNGAEPSARAIEALLSGGEIPASQANELMQQVQNAPAGLGSFQDQQPDVLDAALALRALTQVPELDPTALAYTVGYLQSTQAPDGSWGYMAGEAGNAYVTACTTEALVRVKTIYNVASTLDAAFSWLATELQADGSAHESPLATAGLIRAFALDGRPLPSTTVAPSEYLVTIQRADGSWEDDDFITSEALMALVQVGPDLAILPGGVQLSESSAAPGDSLLITATIQNVGMGESDPFQVEISDGTPRSGGVLLGEIPANALQPGTLETVQFTWTVPVTAGNRRIYVVADPEGMVDPLANANNSSYASLTIQSQANLAINTYSISAVPGQPQPDEAFQLNFAISNLGESSAADVQVAIYNGKPAAGGTLLGQVGVGAVPGGGSASGSLNTTLAAGSYVLYVVADPANVIAESNESDNTASRNVTVGASRNVDFAIVNSDVSITPPNATSGTNATIQALVHNYGSEEAATVVAIYDGDPGHGGTLIGNQTASLPSNGSMIISVNYTIEVSTQFFTVLLDPDNSIQETNEQNNAAQAVLSANLPDLSLGEQDIRFSMEQPYPNTAITLYAKVHNAGFVTASNINVEFYTDAPSAGGTKIGQTQIIPTLAAQSDFEVSVGWTTAGTGHSITVIVDRSEQIVESNESNNQASRYIAIVDSVTPDLYVSEVVTNSIVVDPETLSLSGDITVAIGNVGYGNCTAPFSVSVYEETVRDMRLDPEKEREFGRIQVTQNVAKGSSIQVTITVSGSASFVGSMITVMADSTSAVSEVNESNNTWQVAQTCPFASGTASVPGKADLWLAGQSLGKAIGGDRVGDDANPQQRAVDSGFTLVPGQIVITTATGNTSYTPSPTGDTPNGGYYPGFWWQTGGYLGISYLSTHWNSLTGVFIGPDIPDPNPSTGPPALIFPALSMTPIKQQAFKVGAGPTTLVVPDGATRLFFGSHDTTGTNYNNWGQFDVTVRVSDGPDLVPSYLHADPTLYPESVTLIVRVGNGSEGPVAAGVATISFYDGDPLSGGILLGSVQNHDAILSGQFEEERLLWSNPAPGPHSVYVVANPDLVLEECNTANNTTFAQMTFEPIGTTLPDLSVSNADIALVQSIPYSNQVLDILIAVHNISTQDTNNVAVSLFDGDPSSGGIIVGTVIIDSLPGESVAPLQFKWDTKDLEGIHYLHVLVDPNNLIEETNELNNQAFTSVDLLPPPQPDLQIADADLSMSPVNPMQGDILHVVVTIHNAGSPASNVRVGLYLDGPSTTGILLSEQTIPTMIATGDAETLTFTIDDPALAGAHVLFAMADPENAIQELNEENNQGQTGLLLRLAGWTTYVVTNKSLYLPQEDVLVTATVTNDSSEAKDAQLSVVIVSGAGNPVEALSAPDMHHWEAGESINFPFTWNTGASLGGPYRVHVIVVEQDQPRDQAWADFAVSSIPAIGSTIHSDRDSYPTHYPVVITSIAENTSVNYFYEELSAHVEVLDPDGNVLATYDQPVGNLYPSDRFTFKVLWNTGTNPAGVYTASLAVSDDSGTVLTGTTTVFTITGSGTQGLTGTLSITPNPVPYPNDAVLSYTVANTGNVNFSGTLHVKVVDPLTSIVLNDFTASLDLPMGDTSSGSFTQAGAGLLNQSYTSGLSAEDGTGTRSLAAMSFTVVDAVPPAVTILAPSAGACVNGPVTFTALVTADFTEVAVVEAKLDNQSGWQPMTRMSGDAMSGTYALAFTPQASDEGERTLLVRATDASGNGEDTLPADSNPASVGFTVDVTAPTVLIATPAEGACAAPGLIPDISGSDAHGIHWTVTLNGLPYTLGTPITEEGSYTLQASATDDCGNASVPVIRHFAIDLTAPTVTIVSPQEGACAQPGIIPEVAGSDVTTLTWTLLLDGQPYTKGTPIEAEGDHTLAAYATDACGSASTVATCHFSVDGTPPQITVVSPAEGEIVAPGLIPDIQGSDSHGVTLAILLDGAPYTIGTPIDIPGAHTLVISATDGCGNTSEPITRNFTVQGTSIPVLPSYVNRFAWFGCEWLTDNGHTHVAGVSSVGSEEVFGGHIGSDGPITIDGSNTINGNASPGPGAAVTVNGTQNEITGSTACLPAPLVCEEQSVAAWAVYAQENQNNAAIPGQFLDGNGNFKLNGNKTCTLPGGLYYLSSFTANGSGKLILTDPVVIVVDGFITINGHNKINEGGDPASLLFVSASSSQILLDGTAVGSFKVYAPLAPVKLAGNVTGHGNLWGWTFTGDGSVVWNRLLDTSAPTLSITAPAGGSTVTTPQPALSLSYQDASGGTGVNTASLQAFMDGSEITSALTVNAASASGQAPDALAPGDHTFEASISDFDGNTAQAQSAFTVAGARAERQAEHAIRLKLYPAEAAVTQPVKAGQIENSVQSLCDGSPIARLPATQASRVLEISNAASHDERLRVEVTTGEAGLRSSVKTSETRSYTLEAASMSVRKEKFPVILPSNGSSLAVKVRVFLLTGNGECLAGEFTETVKAEGLPISAELSLALEDLRATLAEELTQEAREAVTQAIAALEPLKTAWSTGPSGTAEALNRLNGACQALTCCPATNGCSAHLRIARLIRMAKAGAGE